MSFSFSLGELELRCAHHQMHEAAYGRVAGVRFTRFEILRKGGAVFLRRRHLQKAPAQKIDKFVRPVAQFVRNNFRDVDRVTVDSTRELLERPLKSGSGPLKKLARRID